MVQSGEITVAYSSPLVSARRDAVALTVLICAVMLLIWNGSAFFQQMSIANGDIRDGVKLASTALTLNVALILFGWRRYADLQQETERRVDGEIRAAVAARTDAVTGLLNRKGFADRAERMCADARSNGRHVAIVSLQIHRFKTVNDRHGYEMGDELLRRISASRLAKRANSSPSKDFSIARTFSINSWPCPAPSSSNAAFFP